MGGGYIDKYSPVEKSDDEYAIDSYYAMRRELCYIGYDPSMELWAEEPFSLADMDLQGKQSVAMRAENDGYVQFANKISFYVREMAAMVAIHLHETDGFGAVRLRRCLDPFVADWMRLMRIYLHKDKAGLDHRRGAYPGHGGAHPQMWGERQKETRGSGGTGTTGATAGAEQF